MKGSGELALLIDHLFLPPKLPQSSDDDADGHVSVIDRVVDAAKDFLSTSEKIQGTHQDIWSSVVNMLTRMQSAHQHNHLTKDGLYTILDELNVGDVLPLHVSSQNAGLIIRKPTKSSITVEGFEASLPAATVTSAPGKLVATFPATPRLALPISAELLVALAALLEELDREPLAAAMPATIKAGSAHQETYDTADPRYVTELLAGISVGLAGDGEPETVAASTVRVTKRLADLVLWSNADLPWRRSPKWLVIRVALQTTLHELGAEPLYGYKMFVAYLLAGVLKDACRQDHEQPPHLVDVMRAKLARRVYKMSDIVDHNPTSPVVAYITGAIDDACTYLSLNAEKIHAEQRRPLGWCAPSKAELEDAQNFSMKHSLVYIKEIQDRTQCLKNAHGDFDYEAYNARLLREADSGSSVIPPAIVSKRTALDRMFSILEIERWASNDISDWADGPDFSFEKLARAITAHLKAAHDYYGHNPEIFSRMILTVFEMWVVLDRKTLREIPLLARYILDIPDNLLEPLLLRTREEMGRLLAVETYLARRHAGTTCQQSPIYQCHALSDTFQVVYMESSSGLVALRQTIIDKATTDKAAKQQELTKCRAEYKRLLNRAKQLSCEYTTRTRGDGHTYRSHSSSCHKCALKSQASAMTITVFEWPLPHNDAECKRAVFELRPPAAFAIWRYTVYELLQTFRKDARESHQDVKQHLTEYPPLSAHVLQPPLGTTLSLASAVKSDLGSHCDVSTVTSCSQVILNHPLTLELYDKSRAIWPSNPRILDMRDCCIFKLPPQSPYSPLQFALDSTTHTPNTVIASQSSCPVKISLHEWDAFGHLRAGHRLQWRNIVLQLYTSNLTFSDPAVHLLVSQAAWQAEVAENSPGANDKTSRQAHADLADDTFGREMLDALDTKLNIIQENWQESWTIATLAVLACRLYSLTRSNAVKLTALEFLKRIRGVAYGWLRQVVEAHQERARKGEPSKTEQTLSMQRIILVAAIVRSTFDVRREDLQDLLSDRHALACFIEASFHICSYLPANTKELPLALRLIIERDQILSISCTDMTRAHSVQQESGLARAVCSVWSGFPTQADWIPLNDYWLYAFTSPSQKGCVHVNLRDGELRVDGKTIGNLPHSITGSQSFRAVFPGYYTIESISSRMPGMHYELVGQFYGQEVHILQEEKDIIIRTCKPGESDHVEKAAEYIPSSLLSQDIPHDLIIAFAHWFREDPSGWSIDFRPRSHPLDALNPSWTMETADPQRCLYNRQKMESVLDPHSTAMDHIFDVFHRMESSRLHVLATCHHNQAAVNNLAITLPRYKLSFSVTSEKMLESLDIVNMVISENQYIGALHGLQSGIILEDKCFAWRRQLLLPFTSGITISSGMEHHPKISVHPSSDAHVRHIVYDIDSALGRLHGSGTLSSWLYCALLHALTSCHASDSLTGRTGTEIAVSMLQNATSRSFMRLEDYDRVILNKISKLTPVRGYYPPHLSAMQQEEWHPGLSPSVQDDRYAALVQDILGHARDLARIDTSSHNSDRADLPLRTNENLRHRAEIRAGLFQRPVRVGEEARGSDTIAVLRGSLLSEHSRQRTATVFEITALVEKWSSCVPVVQDLWNRLETWSTIPECDYSPERRLTDMHLWLRQDLQGLWLTLLRLCCEVPRRRSLIFALSSISYHHSSGLDLAKTLLACAVHSLPRQTIPLPGDEQRFDLNQGWNVSRSDIRSLAEHWCNDFTSVSSESEQARERRAAEYRSRRQQQINDISVALRSQWPSSDIGVRPSGSDFNLIDVSNLVEGISTLFARRYPNYRLRKFVLALQGDLNRHHSLELVASTFPSLSLGSRLLNSSTASMTITLAALICQSQPEFEDLAIQAVRQQETEVASEVSQPLKDLPQIDQHEDHATRTELEGLVNELGNESLYGRYSKDLYASLSSLKRVLSQSRTTQAAKPEPAGSVLLGALSDTLSPPGEAIGRHILHRANLWPAITPTTLLSELRLDARHRHVPRSMEVLVRFAQGILLSQKHLRVDVLRQAGLQSEVAKEWENMPTVGPVSEEHVDWILIQIDAGFAIRGVQEDIANRMIHPNGGVNAVMQLNMGEGKSSVIVPIACGALAAGKKLVRVLVLKPLAPQMFHVLRSRLSGLANRRIYYLPFHRGVPLDDSTIPRLREMFETCARTGGILLAQPEHILSLKLMTMDKIQSCGSDVLSSVPSALYELQAWLDETGRDILDESDEILHTRYQLIYTCGNPAPLDGHPYRWAILAEVFTVVLECLPDFCKQGSLEVLRDCPEHPSECRTNRSSCRRDRSRFPITRILGREGDHPLLTEVARRIVYDDRLETLSFKAIEDEAYRFITEIDGDRSISDPLRSKLEQDGRSFVFQGLLLLRGLFAHQIILSALRLKRWRVDYGLDPERRPETLMAVPYRAKDSPSLRSEYGHPEMRLMLTMLSYYYGGLTDSQLETTFERLHMANNPATIYEAWVRRSTDCIDKSLRTLDGINLDDHELKYEKIFPQLRHNKFVIDFFLEECVFPKEAKEFPHKLTTSGWDIARARGQLVTGFSGTNDNKWLLPLDIRQLDSETQRHTNAEVLTHLLRPENRKVERLDGGGNWAEALVDCVLRLSPEVKVFLDVGAQVLEWENDQLAREWLKKDTSPTTEAAIYFDKRDEPHVVDRQGRDQLLSESPYRSRLGSCLVYLDDAHTRGVDFKFPSRTRAAVTLGPRLTKDKLVQGCMRMRKLGQLDGHSVVFIAPEEICREMGVHQDPKHELNSSDVVRWTMRETVQQLAHNVPMWAAQGVGFARRLQASKDYAWRRIGTGDFGDRIREPESRTLKELYDVQTAHDLFGEVETDRTGLVRQVRARYTEYGATSTSRAQLQEEQERELSQEEEEEREVERAPSAMPAPHTLEQDVRRFVTDGTIREGSSAFRSLCECLVYTDTQGPPRWDHSYRILATHDFARTIKIPKDTQGAMVEFLRPVKWILSCSSESKLVLISPFEANELLPDVRRSSTVTLHLYAPKVSRTVRGFDALDFLTAFSAATQVPQPLARDLAEELNLFAGQLFLKDHGEYLRVRQLVGESFGADYSTGQGPPQA